MASLESEAGSKSSNEIKQRARKNRTKKKKTKNGAFRYLPKFRCFSLKSETTDGSFDMDMEVEDEAGRGMNPTHLVIMVNGLIGSAEDWRYAATQFVERYPEDVVVHCSECNCSTLTFDGVDVMGERLAEEVKSVIKRHPSVQKISFVGHSLGGLIARYAIGRLYERDTTRELSLENGECRGNGFEDPSPEQKAKSKIAGLEPVNFITSATPHLGSWGHKQVPVFCGFQILEKAAASTSWCLGRTGRHLFLTDRDKGKPPLLLQMLYDSEDLKFLSALKSFRRHVAYANVHYDHLVGWSTSSIRRKKELPKLKHLSRDNKYPHIVNEDMINTASTQEEVALEDNVNIDFEEEMIRGLTKVSWERIDVSFSGSRQKYLAHNTIQVKTYCIHSDGADVIQHMVDNFRI
ncbi:putative lipase ROG1 isoform X2 [Rosa chinensis]|uniref:putative lipase ROG1 isoform X2 n=1 Tax=Rosa chinensis TaxID=74649 RepID=UPI000D08F9E7|nr:putative lipase ROG1 isoform X2 [Rosa chinensis]